MVERSDFTKMEGLYNIRLYYHLIVNVFYEELGTCFRILSGSSDSQANNQHYSRRRRMSKSRFQFIFGQINLGMISNFYFLSIILEHVNRHYFLRVVNKTRNSITHWIFHGENLMCFYYCINNLF